MNYLAHFALGEHDAAGFVGALLGDFVRGSLTGTRSAPTVGGAPLPPAVVDAVRLHRAVDSFTDAHPVHARSRARFEPPARRYAGIIVDVAYDHFLARDWTAYMSTPLPDFAAHVYASLAAESALLGPNAARLAAGMRRHGSLTGYADEASIGRVLAAVSRRLRRQPNPLADAGALVAARYDVLAQDFAAFFPDLLRFASDRIGCAARAN